jgi:hypothetical protein
MAIPFGSASAALHQGQSQAAVSFAPALQVALAADLSPGHLPQCAFEIEVRETVIASTAITTQIVTIVLRDIIRPPLLNFTLHCLVEEFNTTRPINSMTIAMSLQYCNSREMFFKCIVPQVIKKTPPQ